MVLNILLGDCEIVCKNILRITDILQGEYVIRSPRHHTDTAQPLIKMQIDSYFCKGLKEFSPMANIFGNTQIGYHKH